MVFLIFLFQSHFVSMEQPQCQWLEIQKGPFFSGLRTWEAIPDLTAQDQRTGDTPCHITTIPSASRTGQQDCQVCVYDACPNPPDLTHQPSRGPPDQPSLERGRLVAPNNAPTDLARQLGRAGEDAAGIVQGAKQRIPSVTRPGRHRVPDELNEVTLREIKNVANQSNTSQLRDFLEYAKNTNRTFILETRATTKISGPLQKLIDQGRIVHRVIGK